MINRASPLRRIALAVVFGFACLVAPAAFAQMDGMDHDAADEHAMDHTMMMEPVVDEYSFIAGMIPHHQEAVDTGLHVFVRTHRPEMRAFTWGIVTSQLAEIDLMNGWLAAWYPERSGEARYMPMMRDLTDLDPDTLDRVFLEDMIMHHEGAVMMARMLLDDGLAEHPEVAELARAIIAAQRAEIDQMRAWLDAWF